jgi:type II secretory pathway pseudopilin PulG
MISKEMNNYNDNDKKPEVPPMKTKIFTLIELLVVIAIIVIDGM